MMRCEPQSTSHGTRGAPQRYALKSPWKADRDIPAQTVTADAEYPIALRPFEVRVLEATPEEYR